MSPESDADVLYVVRTVDQWKVRPSDLKKAMAQKGIGAKVTALMQLYRHSRVGRALARYGYQRGRLAAGGISYMALFSIAAAVAVGWTIFAHLFARDPELQSSVAQAVNQLLPGVIADPATGTKGLLDPAELEIGRGNLIAGIVAFCIAVYSASRVVRYLSDGIRSMFGLLAYPKNLLKVYPRYLLGLVLLTSSVFATAALSLASNWLDNWLTETLKLSHSLRDSLTFDTASILIPLVVDFVTFALTVRFVAAVRVPKRALLLGATAFALAAAVLREASELVVNSSTNPLVIAAATVGTLLLWVNLLARTALICCAWMANPPAVVARVTPEEINSSATPNYVTLSEPSTLQWPYHPISGDLIPASRVPSGPLPLPDDDPATKEPLQPRVPVGPETAAWMTTWPAEKVEADEDPDLDDLSLSSDSNPSEETHS